MSHSKRGAQATAIGMICVLLGVISFEIDSGVAEQEAMKRQPPPGRRQRDHH